MRNASKNTSLVLLVGTGVLALVVATAAYAWLFFEVRHTLEDVARTAEAAQLVATRNAHTQTVRRVVRDTEAERAELDNYFLREESIVTFLEDIEELGVHAGAPLTVQSVSVEDALDKDERIVPLHLVLRSEGSLQELFYIMQLLETFPAAVSLQKVQLTQHVENLTWDGTFHITVLRLTRLNVSS